MGEFEFPTIISDRVAPIQFTQQLEKFLDHSLSFLIRLGVHIPPPPSGTVVAV